MAAHEAPRELVARQRVLVARGPSTHALVEDVDRELARDLAGCGAAHAVAHREERPVLADARRRGCPRAGRACACVRSATRKLSSLCSRIWPTSVRANSLTRISPRGRGRGLLRIGGPGDGELCGASGWVTCRTGRAAGRCGSGRHAAGALPRAPARRSRSKSPGRPGRSGEAALAAPAPCTRRAQWRRDRKGSSVKTMSPSSRPMTVSALRTWNTSRTTPSTVRWLRRA